MASLNTALDITLCVLDDEDEYLELFSVACAKFSLRPLVLLSRLAQIEGMISRAFPATLYTVFFLDVNIGRETSFEIGRSLRQSAHYRYSPIVYMSTGDLQSDVRMALDAGGNCYFHKPTGSRDRIEMIQAQVEFWTTRNTLAIPNFKSDTSFSANPAFVSTYKETKGNRARGTPLYTIDRLRQDILVALLKDLDVLGTKDLPYSTRDKLIKCMNRFKEIFNFRTDVFGSAAVLNIEQFAGKIIEYCATSVDDFRTRSAIVDEAKILRASLSKVLGFSRIKDDSDGQLLTKMDYLIWEVFSDLAESPSFPNVYLSLKRFRSRAF